MHWQHTYANSSAGNFTDEEIQTLFGLIGDTHEENNKKITHISPDFLAPAFLGRCVCLLYTFFVFKRVS
jgi:hypothetical protein